MSACLHQSRKLTALPGNELDNLLKTFLTRRGGWPLQTQNPHLTVVDGVMGSFL